MVLQFMSLCRSNPVILKSEFSLGIKRLFRILAMPRKFSSLNELISIWKNPQSLWLEINNLVLLPLSNTLIQSILGTKTQIIVRFPGVIWIIRKIMRKLRKIIRSMTSQKENKIKKLIILRGIPKYPNLLSFQDHLLELLIMRIWVNVARDL